MAMNATLNGAPVDCPHCGVAATAEWQFYFGEVSDNPAYTIGDSIRWDGAAQFASPTMDLVYAVAYPTDELRCSGCGQRIFAGEVKIRGGRIEELHAVLSAEWSEPLLYEGEERTPRTRAEIFHRNRPAG